MKNQPATKSIMHGITVLADEVVSVLPLPVLEPTNPETAPISVFAFRRFLTDGATKTLGSVAENKLSQSDALGAPLLELLPPLASALTCETEGASVLTAAA